MRGSGSWINNNNLFAAHLILSVISDASAKIAKALRWRRSTLISDSKPGILARDFWIFN
jgi:hypothetical protein